MFPSRFTLLAGAARYNAIYNLHENRCLPRVDRHAFSQKFCQITGRVHAQPQRLCAATRVGGKRGANFPRSCDVGLHREEESISREPLRQKGRCRFGLLLQQHVGHGLPVEREGERLAQLRVRHRRLRVIETQTIQNDRRRRPHAQIILHGAPHEIRRQFHQIGFAQLQIKELPQQRNAQRHINGIQKGPARPRLLIRAEVQMR